MYDNEYVWWGCVIVWCWWCMMDDNDVDALLCVMYEVWWWCLLWVCMYDDDDVRCIKYDEDVSLCMTMMVYYDDDESENADDNVW